MPCRVEGVAVVAGGSAGVGRAVARALARDGWKVAILARGEGRLKAAEAELSQMGPAALAVVCDVSDAAAVEAAADRIEAELGPIGVWVNDAMLTAFMRFDRLPPADFERIVRTTFIGQVNGTRAAVTRMERRGRPARVVNIGSALSYRSIPLQSAYCAAKHAVMGFTAAIRCELLARNSPVTISLVQLPAVNTPQFTWAKSALDEWPQPAPPVFAPEAAAAGVMRAVNTGARETFVGGSVAGAVFGQFFFPGWLDRKLAREGADMQKSGEPAPGDRPHNLDGPVDLDVAADGRYGDLARARARLFDADSLRLLMLAGVAGAGFVAGLAVAGLG